MDLKIEFRHSDYGEDAGGYSVLRFNDKWLARVSDTEAARELLKAVKDLENQLKFQEEILEYHGITDLDFEKRTFKVLADKTKWHGVWGTNG